MKDDKIFRDSDILITAIKKLIIELQTELIKKGYSNQRKFNIENGLVYKNGIYVPLETVDHKILFDGYEDGILNTFIKLYDKLHKKFDSSFAQFALRTLQEIGLERFQILFGEETTSDEKNKYKLFLWFADYAFLAEKYEYRRSYLKLLAEYKKLLTEKEYIFYSQLIEELKNITPIEKIKRIVKIRQRINSFQATLLKKTTILPLIKEINIVSANANFSHALHGNILILNDVLENKTPERQKLRVYWILALSGINASNLLNSFLKISAYDEKVEILNQQFKELSIVVEKGWSKF